MNIPKNPNLKYVLTILALVLYVGVKDVVTPLVKGVTEGSSRDQQPLTQSFALATERRLVSLEKSVDMSLAPLQGVPKQLAVQEQILKSLNETVQQIQADLKEHIRGK